MPIADFATQADSFRALFVGNEGIVQGPIYIYMYMYPLRDCMEYLYIYICRVIIYLYPLRKYIGYLYLPLRDYEW